MNLGYDLYCLGHVHVNYPTVYEGTAQISRPGSFLRGTSHAYNLARDVWITVIEKDGGNVTVENQVFPVSPADEVFSSIVTDKSDVQELSADLSEQFSKLITLLETPRSEVSSVYKILDQINPNKEVKARVVEYLEGAGIFREKNVEE